MINNIAAIFSKRLKSVRKKEGISQIELANKLGITRQSISYYENGERLPDIQILADICRLMDCSPNYLLGMQETMQDRNADISAITGLSEESIERISNNRPGSAILNFAVVTDEFWNLLRCLDYLARVKIKLSPDMPPDIPTAFFEFSCQIELNKLIQRAKEEEAGQITQEEADWLGDKLCMDLLALQMLGKWVGLLGFNASKFNKSRTGITDFNSIQNMTGCDEQEFGR